MSAIAVLNAGSSSIKLAVYSHASTPELLLKGRFEGIGAMPKALIFAADGTLQTEQQTGPVSHDEATQVLVGMANRALGNAEFSAIGHRVVHGGPRNAAPVMVDDALLDDLESYVPLAPLHQPHNLAPIRMIRKLMPALPQVACFDTAFHIGQAWQEQAFALPRELTQEGVRRYGFHGISHQVVSQRAAELLGRPLAELKQIVLHLGNGASACAVDSGRSVDTSMGLTPLEGLVMGTRSGDIDPGALLHLMRAGLSVDALDRLLNKQSGLLGLAGSNDMRDIRAGVAAGDPAAKLAFDIYVRRLKHYIGAYLALLGGADTIVFTAGVGENHAPMREAVCSGLEWLGIEIDPVRNESPDRGARVVSSDASRVAILVVPTEEEAEIARQAAEVTAR